MAAPPEASILHADLDAFYASVEQLLDPTLQGRPLAVGGGVVLAASYEARAFGVHAGMSGSRARRLCPGLIVAGGHYREYQRLGDAVIDVVRDFTPFVERISIDEAFAEVAGAVHLFGSPETIADTIRRRVREEIGLPISIGVATTKHLAKVASQVAKPDGLVVVDAGSEIAFLDPLPVGLLWGVGPTNRERLAASGIHTVGQLAATTPRVLERLLGTAVGTKLGALARNADPRTIETQRQARSMGAQCALGRQPVTDELVRTTMGYLADRVAPRLRAGDLAGRTLTVRVRFPGLRSITRSTSLPEPTAGTRALTELGVRLVGIALADEPSERDITLLGISVSNLVADRPRQLAFAFDRPARTAQHESRRALDRSMDEVRARFGREALTYARTRFGRSGGVPDEFRELAERAPSDDVRPV